MNFKTSMEQPEGRKATVRNMNDKRKEHIIFSEMFDIDEGNAVSVTECTGLIPSAPHTREELDAYDEIINYSPSAANIFNMDGEADADNFRSDDKADA